MKRRAAAVIMAISLFITAHVLSPADSYADIWDLFGYLDLEQCFLPSYTCVPLGCGCDLWDCYDAVCHNYPAAFVETPSSPWQSEVPIIGDLISVFQSASGGGGLNKYGGGGSTQQGDTNLKYFEAHVFDFPTSWYIHSRYPFLRLCNYDNDFELNYLSELDSINWRTGLADYLELSFIFSQLATVSHLCELAAEGGGLGSGLGLSDLCMGTWGPTYPRTGFFIANSKAVGSAADAYRALRVLDNSWGRIVLSPKNLNAQGFMQIGSPTAYRGKPVNCISPGLTPTLWDNATIRPVAENHGYVWVWWQKTCCCKSSTLCL